MSILKSLIINDILTDILPKETYINVTPYKGCFGTNYIAIKFAASHIDINNVRGQKPQLVSLSLDVDSLELIVQVFGGNGGNRIYRKSNKENTKEVYLAMKSVKVPFRTPKKEPKFIYSAIERFAKNWLKTLKDNKDVLMYQDLVDYDALLK